VLWLMVEVAVLAGWYVDHSICMKVIKKCRDGGTIPPALQRASTT